MNLKFNNLYLGLCLGIILPIIFSIFFFFVRYSDYITAEEFVNTLFKQRIYTKLLSVSVFAGNLTSFMLFLKLDKYKTAKGILVASVLYCILVFIEKLFF